MQKYTLPYQTIIILQILFKLQRNLLNKKEMWVWNQNLKILLHFGKDPVVEPAWLWYFLRYKMEWEGKDIIFIEPKLYMNYTKFHI